MDKYGFTEIDAMQQIARAFSRLESDEITRILRWVNDKFGTDTDLPPVRKERPVVSDVSQPAVEHHENSPSLSLGEFYALASPATDAERALTIGYWLQVYQKEKEFDSLTVNSHLKNLGHRVSNITRAFSQLQSKKPQLAVQTRKMGHTQQARKKYQVTDAGKRYLEQRLEAGD